MIPDEAKQRRLNTQLQATINLLRADAVANNSNCQGLEQALLVTHCPAVKCFDVCGNQEESSKVQQLELALQQDAAGKSGRAGCQHPECKQERSLFLKTYEAETDAMMQAVGQCLHLSLLL